MRHRVWGFPTTAVPPLPPPSCPAPPVSPSLPQIAEALKEEVWPNPLKYYFSEVEGEEVLEPGFEGE